MEQIHAMSYADVKFLELTAGLIIGVVATIYAVAKMLVKNYKIKHNIK